MKRDMTMKRHWQAAMLSAVILAAAAAPSTAWGQNQGVRVKTATGETTTNVTSVASEDKDGTATSATPEGTNTTVSDGTIITAGRAKTVTVTTTGPRPNPTTGKMQVAKVKVTKKEDFLASAATITGDETVNKNGTVTLTATVDPTFANSVVWTVTAGTGSAAFVSGETTAATVTAVVDHETGQATATLKGLEAGTVTVNVKAAGDAATTLNETAKTVTVLNVPATLTTAPTATSAASEASYVLYGSSTALVTTGAASGGTMMYAVTTDNTQPAKSAFSSTVPTASGREAGKYYVWYYVQGDDSHIDTDISSTSILVPVVKSVEFNSPFSTWVESTKSITDSNFKIEAWKNSSMLWVSSSDENNRMSISSLNSQKIWKIRLDFNNNNARISVTPTFTPNSPNCSYYYNNVNGNRYSIITRNSTDFIGTSCTMTLDQNNGHGGFNKVTIYYY